MFGKRTFPEVIKVKWGPVGGPKKRRPRHRHALEDDHVRTRRERPRGTSPADTLASGTSHQRWEMIGFCCLSCCQLGVFVPAARRTDHPGPRGGAGAPCTPAIWGTPFPAAPTPSGAWVTPSSHPA